MDGWIDRYMDSLREREIDGDSFKLESNGLDDGVRVSCRLWRELMEQALIKLPVLPLRLRALDDLVQPGQTPKHD
jgi:hypothetical protein